MSNPGFAPSNGELFATDRDMRVAIVRTMWNGHITGRLLDGALDTFAQARLHPEDVNVFEVPGAVELTFAASRLIDSGFYDAIIVLGCVIRGGTPHFDYVCQSVTQGITHLNSECDIPVIFGVLTVDTEKDALDRAGGSLGNKGAEAAEAALAMFDFMARVEDI